MAPRPRQRRRPESEPALFFVPSAMPKRRKHRRNNSLLSPKPFGEKDRIVKDVDEDEGLLWAQQVQIRPKSQRKPMTGWLRWKANVGKNVLIPAVSASGLSASILGRSSSSEIPGGPQDAANTTPMKKQSSVNQFRESHVENGVSPASEVDDESSDDEDSFGERLQYTVKSIKKNENCADQMLGFLAPNVDENVYTPNTLFCRYLNWTFRSGFFMVFLTFLVFFMVLTLAFGVFLEIAGKRNPECIVVAGEPFGTNPNTTLADAYGLSWTTFTTVGYGALYTATGNDHGPQATCWVVNGLCTTESFIGLLYAGMCAAILFGKIQRVQSHAQIDFSDAVCITYGDGSDNARIRAQPSLSENADMNILKTPNLSHRTPTIVEGEETVETVKQTDGFNLPCPVLSFQVVNLLCNERGGEIMDAQLKLVAANNRRKKGENMSIAMYRKITLTEFEHPFFSRVWVGRHTLDYNSPLLNKFARSMIRQNGGYWPADWNNPHDIRNALQFTDLIVTLTGISNVSASTVHSYKRFKYGDVLVGYTFANMLFAEQDSSRLLVDNSLVNDVVEQAGGGAEPFDYDPDNDDSDGEEQEISWGARSIHIAASKRADLYP